MIDPQPLEQTLIEQAEHERMRRFEDIGTLHADRRQFVHVEESPIVDFVGGHAPERQAIRLFFQEAFQEVEAARIADAAVEERHILLYPVPQRREILRTRARDAA